MPVIERQRDLAPERLSDFHSQRQAVAAFEDCLSPFCLHASQISERLQIASR
jgi:hypothetical protein